MTALILFDQFTVDRGNGKHNMSSDTFKVVFSNDAPDPTIVDPELGDIIEITPGGGYPAGGLPLTITGWGQVAGLATWTTANLTFVPTGDVGPFQYVVIYNATAAGNPLVGYYNRSSPVTLHAGGDPFILYFSVPGVLLREKQVAVF